jgi:hypothetical protein
MTTLTKTEIKKNIKFYNSRSIGTGSNYYYENPNGINYISTEDGVFTYTDWIPCGYNLQNEKIELLNKVAESLNTKSDFINWILNK